MGPKKRPKRWKRASFHNSLIVGGPPHFTDSLIHSFITAFWPLALTHAFSLDAYSPRPQRAKLRALNGRKKIAQGAPLMLA
ncbi:hypothetical protein SBV1_3110010 [Verrucomicrobia bacterium]|nr:hypothetical protein SBV1_3110010 [Verrucomicrobiota bacterium]